jgi:Transcriptional regulator, AbiEi antitoxin
MAPSGVHEILETAALQAGGLITTSALRRIGGPSHTARTMVARGELVRIAHGIYVDGATWRAGSSEERYRLFVRDVVHPRSGARQAAIRRRWSSARRSARTSSANR